MCGCARVRLCTYACMAQVSCLLCVPHVQLSCMGASTAPARARLCKACCKQGRQPGQDASGPSLVERYSMWLNGPEDFASSIEHA